MNQNGKKESDYFINKTKLCHVNYNPQNNTGFGFVKFIVPGVFNSPPTLTCVPCLIKEILETKKNKN